MEIKKGYTLIEVLIAVLVFFAAVAGPTGLFVASLRSQSRSLVLREAVDNASHGIEYMSRALRMAKKELDCINKDDPATCACLQSGGYGTNYEITRGGAGIKFKSYEKATGQSSCQEFFWDTEDKRLKEEREEGIAVPFTSDDLEVDLLKFEVLGGDQEDNIQPRVNILLEISKEDLPDFSGVKIQTTISQRNLDVTY